MSILFIHSGHRPDREKQKVIDIRETRIYFRKLVKAAAKIVVRGMVQGVGFRYYIYCHASRLGLVGFTRNLSDGNVEIQLEGEQDRITVLLGEAQRGPLMARVKRIEVEWQEFQHRYTGFEIRH